MSKQVSVAFGRQVGPLGEAPGGQRVQARGVAWARAFLPGVLCAASCLNPLAAAGEESRGPRRIVYDYAVTSYCGTLTPQVDHGYRLELAEATAREGLNEEEAKAERIAGWVDADLEWGNRGLGGYRAWCASEGVSAAEHFLNIHRDATVP